MTQLAIHAVELGKRYAVGEVPSAFTRILKRSSRSGSSSASSFVATTICGRSAIAASYAASSRLIVS